MGWETRKNGTLYYYRSVREGNRVRKEYYGSGFDAAAAEEMFEKLKKARKELRAQRKQIRQEARTSASRLNQLLKIPFEQLVEVLAPSKPTGPALTSARKKLIGSSSPQELANWGWIAIHHQLELASLEKPNSFEQARELVLEKRRFPPGRTVHLIVQLFYDRFLLETLQAIHFFEMASRRSRRKGTHWETKTLLAIHRTALAKDAYRDAEERALHLSIPPRVLEVLGGEDTISMADVRHPSPEAGAA